MQSLHMRLGLGACAFSLFMIFFAIPFGVSSPSNVNNIILSPLFWPYILAGFTGIVGLGLIATSFSPLQVAPAEDDADVDPRAGWIRLGAMALIMVAIMLLMPRLGMVWTCMLAFLATAFLLRTRFPRAAVVCAIVFPLILYAFFAHVAGVAIPQGDFVRLP